MSATRACNRATLSRCRSNRLLPLIRLDKTFPARRNCRNDLCRGLRGWIASPVLSTASVLSPRSDPDLRLRLGQCIPSFIHCKGHKIPVRSILDYRDTARLGFDHPGPSHPKSPDFRNSHLAILPVPHKTTPGKFSALRSALGAETRIFSAFCKETAVCRLQLTQALLQGHARNLAKETVSRIFLKPRQMSAGLVVRNGFARCSVGFRTELQRPVESPADTAKQLGKSNLLPSRWVEPESMPHLDLCSQEHTSKERELKTGPIFVATTRNLVLCPRQTSALLRQAVFTNSVQLSKPIFSSRLGPSNNPPRGFAACVQHPSKF